MDTITITREQFREAVRKCNEEYGQIAGELDERDETGISRMHTFIMVAQNNVFGAAIEYELFKTKEDN